MHQPILERAALAETECIVSQQSLNRPFWCAVFLEALAKCGTVCGAAKAASVDRTTASRRRKHDSWFATQWNAALQDRADQLLRAVQDRLIEGYPRVVLHKGKPVFQWVNADG